MAKLVALAYVGIALAAAYVAYFVYSTGMQAVHGLQIAGF